MEPQPAPRAEDSVMGRGSPMVKENPHLPGAGYQLRPQGHPPPRYPPINNGGPVGGGPRLGGQQAPPALQRLDSRASLGSPTGPPGGQFVQQRAPFGPPRPQNPQGYQIPGSRPPLPPNPSVLQGPPRYPGPIPGSPGPRPPQNNFPGPRPPIYNPNQPQQIYYQPRIGEIRSQRPPESGGPPQIRFASAPHNPEARHPGPQIIPDTVVTPPVRNDSPLRDPRINQSSAGPRDFTNDRRSQPPRHPRDKMEVIDSRSPTPGAPESESNKGQEDNDTMIKRKPSPRHSDENEDDDDDVVMDREKEMEKSGTATPRVDSPANSYKKSASPSPVPPSERPESAMKVENEPRSGNISKTASPVPPDVDVKHSPEPPTDLGSEKRNPESRSSSVASNRSPIPPRTPDHLATLTVPGSASPQGSPASPKSPKSPQGSVKGFDNGQLRSLSPKSPTPSASPASPNAPNSPAISARSDSDKRKATFAQDSELAGETMINNGETTKEPEKIRPMTPGSEAKGKPPTPSKANERAQTPGTPDGRKSSMKRSTSGRSIKSDAGSDSGANHVATPTTNGVSVSPTKKFPSKSREGEKRSTAGSPVKSPSKSVKSLPRTPEAGPPSTADKKKVPMNKIQVGAAPSPNLKTVRSKIGSLDNASYKPGGGKVKIENRKLDFSKAQPKIAAKNDKYMPSGGDKKITQVKLQWNAKPKVGSLDNATYKPGGGDKKIETVKLDFKDKAKPKVGSKDNAKHVPGGGTVKSSATPPKTPQDPPNDIETQKIDVKAESKIGSLDNVKHKPGGGDKKIFNDRDYLRQTGSNVESLNGSGAQIKSLGVAERPTFIEMKSNPPEPNPPPTTPTRSRASSAVSPVTPRALRTSLQAKTPDSPTAKRVSIAEESPPSTRKSAEVHQTPSRPKTPRSPSGSSSASSRPPSSLDTKSAALKSPKSSRKSSPTGLHLPKLMSPQSPDNSNEVNAQNTSKIKLPKLSETSTLSSRVELTQ